MYLPFFVRGKSDPKRCLWFSLLTNSNYGNNNMNVNKKGNPKFSGMQNGGLL